MKAITLYANSKQCERKERNAFLPRRCYLPVFPTPRKQKQEDQEFEPACLTQRALVIYKQINESIL